MQSGSAWFYLSQFLFSLPSALGQQIALHGLFGVTLGSVENSLSNAALGAAGRKPVGHWIAKHQNSGNQHLHESNSSLHSVRKTIFLNVLVPALITTVRIAHLNNWGNLLPTIYWGLAALGVTWETWLHFFKSFRNPDFDGALKQWRKDIEIVKDAVGLTDLRHCSTQLYLMDRRDFRHTQRRYK